MPSDPRVVFGLRLRELRLHRKLSREELADAARLDRTYEALQRLAQQRKPNETRQQRQGAELVQARAELENIKAAIRGGIITPTTRAMLQEAEARISRLEASVVPPPDVPPGRLVAMPSVIEGYLCELRGLLNRDIERARAILGRLVGQIMLQPTKEGLTAVLRGNVAGILGLHYDKSGAGRGI